MLASSKKDIMGFWGIGNFSNNIAVEWITEFCDHPLFSRIELAVNQTFTVKEIENNQKIFEAFAALELVAIFNGNSPDDFTEIEFLLRENTFDTFSFEKIKTLNTLFLHAIDYMVQKESEWTGSEQERIKNEQFQAWLKLQSGLKKRISSPSLNGNP